MLIHLLYDSLVIILSVYINFNWVNPHIPILHRNTEQWYVNEESLWYFGDAILLRPHENPEALNIKIV